MLGGNEGRGEEEAPEKKGVGEGSDIMRSVFVRARCTNFWSSECGLLRMQYPYGSDDHSGQDPLQPLKSLAKVQEIVSQILAEHPEQCPGFVVQCKAERLALR